MGRLDGKVGLISGGARGQGATEAKFFAREGAKVVVGDILDELGQKVEAEIRAAGGEATYVHLDVTDEEQWRAAVATAVQRYGKLDVLVNNAGILLRRSIEAMTVEEWDRIMAVNLKGVFLGTKTAIPAMRDATIHLAQLCLVQYLAKAYGGRYLDGIGGAERVSSHENNSVLDDIFVYTHRPK